MKKIKQSTFQAIPRQSDRINKSRQSKPIEVKCYGLKIIANSGVYQTGGDSELMIDSVKIMKTESFLEIGCGTGAISIALAKKAKEGIAVDINSLAIKNSKDNARKYKVDNVKFFKSDVFEKVKGRFDIIVCNPPYTKHEIKDDVDRMFWDPGDEMKIKFFKEAKNYLKPKGRIYFGWANFVDLDINLPFELSKINGYKLLKLYSKPSSFENFTFYVFEFEHI
ncbi:MAG: HemK2/MTQ2 family protein methyltransferase [Patescibacteria group bacterium]